MCDLYAQQNLHGLGAGVYPDRKSSPGPAHPKLSKPLPDALSLANAERLMWAPDLSTFLGMRDAAILGLLIGCSLRVSGLVALNDSDLRNSDVAGRKLKFGMQPE